MSEKCQNLCDLFKMQISKKQEYISSLKSIIIYISKDSKNRAFDFKSELDQKINSLVNFPYKFKQSIYYSDENTRDMIFKGYTIPYLIDTQNQQIVILDIFKWINKQT